MQKIKENIYAFIDSQNLNLSIRAQGWKLDFAKFRIYLRDKFNVEKAFLFIGYVAGNESLYTSLQEQGYIIWIIHTVCHFEGVFTTEKSKIPHFVRNDRLLF
ncbi:MAG: hypothetical protein CVU78_07320, partial [Elusimicrobia bacterium HGW-Elusimicrobia-2]